MSADNGASPPSVPTTLSVLSLDSDIGTNCNMLKFSFKEGNYSSGSLNLTSNCMASIDSRITFISSIIIFYIDEARIYNFTRENMRL